MSLLLMSPSYWCQIFSDLQYLAVPLIHFFLMSHSIIIRHFELFLAWRCIWHCHVWLFCCMFMLLFKSLFGNNYLKHRFSVVRIFTNFYCEHVDFVCLIYVDIWGFNLGHCFSRMFPTNIGWHYSTCAELTSWCTSRSTT